MILIFVYQMEKNGWILIMQLGIMSALAINILARLVLRDKNLIGTLRNVFRDMKRAKFNLCVKNETYYFLDNKICLYVVFLFTQANKKYSANTC